MLSLPSELAISLFIQSIAIGICGFGGLDRMETDAYGLTAAGSRPMISGVVCWT